MEVRLHQTRRSEQAEFDVTDSVECLSDEDRACASLTQNDIPQPIIIDMQIYEPMKLRLVGRMAIFFFSSQTGRFIRGRAVIANGGVLCSHCFVRHRSVREETSKCTQQSMAYFFSVFFFGVLSDIFFVVVAARVVCCSVSSNVARQTAATIFFSFSKMM